MDLPASLTDGWFRCMNCSFQACAAPFGLAAACHLFGRPPRQRTQLKECLSSFHYRSHSVFIMEFNRLVHKNKRNKINTRDFPSHFLQLLLRNRFLSRLSVFYPISALQSLHIAGSQIGPADTMKSGPELGLLGVMQCKLHCGTRNWKQTGISRSI